MNNIERLMKSHTVTSTEPPKWKAAMSGSGNFYNWEIPDYVGYWKLGSASIMSEKKPNIVHRLFMKWLLGIKWIDNKQ